MATTEQDLEQLEEYLDGALGTTAVSQLQIRLNADTALASALAELKIQRAVRSAVWQSIDPDAASSDRMVWRIKGAMLDQQRSIALEPKKQWNTWRIASFSSAAAACVILGFFFGRVGHDNRSAIPDVSQTGMVVNDSHGSQVGAPSGSQLADSQLVQFLKTVPSTAPTQLAANAKSKFSVPITDEYGRVVAWQAFDNAEDAKNFTEDLHKTRTPSVIPAGAGQPRLVDQQQF